MSKPIASFSLKSRLAKIELPGFLTSCVSVMAPSAIRLSGAGIQFLSTVIIARQLGDEKSAGFFFWAAMLTSLAGVATYGLEHLILRNVPRLHNPESQSKLEHFISSIRAIVLFLSAIIGVGLLVFAAMRNQTSVTGFPSWQLFLPLGLSAIAITLINGETLKGLSRPIAGVFLCHFIPVSLFCVIVVLNRDNLSSPFLIVIYALAYTISIIVIRFGPSKACRSKMFSLPRVEETKATLKEGFPVFCTNTFGALCYIVPLMLLDFLRPAVEVAYVTTSFRISILFLVLAAAMHSVFSPQLSRAASISGNSREIFKVYGKATGITLLALVVPLSIGIAFPEWVMSLFGEQFRAGADNLRILLISGLLSLCLGPTLQLLLMTGNTRIMAKLGLIKLLLASGLSILLIPRFGGMGMVIAMSVAFFLEEVVGIVYVAIRLNRQKTSATINP